MFDHKAYYEKNKEKLINRAKARYQDNKEEKKAYYEANKERIKESQKAYREANKEKRNAQKRAYHERNKEKLLAQQNAYKKANKDKVYASIAKRRASKLNRTPSWLTKEDLAKIEDVYRMARRRSEVEGIQYHVDHIIPLQGKNISGLHVPNNLQILRARDNISKGNRYG